MAVFSDPPDPFGLQPLIHGPNLEAESVLIDLVAGKSSDIPVAKGDKRGAFFSAAGDLFAVWHDDGLAIYETATCRRLAMIDGDPDTYSSWACFVGEAILLEASRVSARPRVELWNPRNGVLLACLENAVLFGRVPLDPSVVLAQRVNKGGVLTNQWLVCNARTLAIEAEFRTKGVTNLFSAAVHKKNIVSAFTDENDVGDYVEVRELPTGRLLGTEFGKPVAFSPDGRFLLIEAINPTVELKMFELPSMALVWSKERRSVADANNNLTAREGYFSQDSKTAYVMQGHTREVNAYDYRSGKLRLAIDTHPRNSPTLRMTPDKGSLLVHCDGWSGNANVTPWWERMLDRIPWITWRPNRKPDATFILDANTCRERFRLDGWGTVSGLLSDDGRTLATLHDDGVIRCWDVDAWKPLHWAAGVPAAAGVLVVLFACWRGRRANNVRSAGGSPAPPV
jgi:WD40 repeat protein